MRRTKILATLGPSSHSTPAIRRLLAAGADALRLNFSHGGSEEQQAVLRNAHAAARMERKEVPIVADLQGPKIRVGELEGGKVQLRDGREWLLDRSPRPGGLDRVGVQLPPGTSPARPGDPVLLGDGSVELVVLSSRRDGIRARVVHGGAVASHAGLHLPKASLRPLLVGPKDREDLTLALAEGVDYVALSFVRSERDVRQARKIVDRLGGSDVQLIAKMERGEALLRVDEILGEADGIMVARGDLGIEVPLDRLALEQKRLIEHSNAHGKPVIVATQMLLSMLRSPRPSRAEATDVANAVLDGADALMLSEESAVGPYAVEAVGWLSRIAETTERAAAEGRAAIHAPVGYAREGLEWAVASTAVHLAHEVGARAIVTPTHSGRTARLVSSHRPVCPILALSTVPETRRQLGLVWGVRARPSPKHLTLLGLRDLAERESRALLGRTEDPAVLTAGYPVEGRPTNLVTILDGAQGVKGGRAGSRVRPPERTPTRSGSNRSVNPPAHTHATV